MKQNAQQYTLTHDQILAIATRAAQIAIEQALGRNVPAFYTANPTPRDPATDGRQLTELERAAVTAIFQ